LECDNNSEFDDYVLHDDVLNGNSDEDDIIQDIMWKDMSNYKRLKENFMCHLVPQGTAKQVAEIVDIFMLCFVIELACKIVDETSRCAEQFLQGCKS
jgi:hypothetical protein